MDPFTLVLVAMLLVIVLLVAFAGRRVDESAVLRLVCGVALLWAGLSIAAAVGIVAVPLSGGTLSIELDASTDISAPHSIDGIVGIVPQTETATVEIGALSSGAVGLVLAGAAMAAVVSAIVAGALAIALRRVAAGDPFAPSMRRSAVIAGSALSVGMLVSLGLSALGRMMAADELNELLGFERFLVGFELDLTPVAIGVAVVALSRLFSVGERLQRETAGLV